MAEQNRRNGGGKGINRIFKPTGAVVCEIVDPTISNKGETARGVRSKVDGTLVVRLSDTPSEDSTIDITAGVKELYDIIEVKAGGTIPFDGDSFYIFW